MTAHLDPVLDKLGEHQCHPVYHRLDRSQRFLWLAARTSLHNVVGTLPANRPSDQAGPLYNREMRSGCEQVGIRPVWTTEGLLLHFEVFGDNPTFVTTMGGYLGEDHLKILTCGSNSHTEYL